MTSVQNQLSPGSLSIRNRLVVTVSMTGIVVLAWVYLIHASGSMDMSSAVRPHPQPWAASEFLFVFLMWAIMMVGMMVPSAMPATMIYAAVVRKATQEHTILAPTAMFVAGYVLMWTFFSMGATTAQWALDRSALLSPMMVTTNPTLGAIVLMAAGLYQLTPLKQSCLARCRSPVQFISERWHPGNNGALRMGIEYGAFCLGCCWLLMALLFVGGVMNLLWVAVIALFVLLEKLVPQGAGAGRVAGAALILAGLVFLGAAAN